MGKVLSISENLMKRKCAAVYTLGCRLNQADSALISGNLEEYGFDLVPWGEPADLLIINSCTVTAAAARKSRQAIRNARAANPNVFIVATGCLQDVVEEGQKIVDLVVPNDKKTSLCELLPSALKKSKKLVGSITENCADSSVFVEPATGLYLDKTRANLKIQQGCNFYCSYCIVPKMRGKPRSRLLEDAVREAKELVRKGYKEIVLTGVNIMTYNCQGKSLVDLIDALLQINGDFRLRLSSVEPGPILSELIDLMANEQRVCSFLHIPLQHGADDILQAMNRRYNVAQYASYIDYAKQKIENVCIGADIIAGFPGENDLLFSRSFEFVEKIDLDYLHVFRYSRRSGTAAAKMGKQVSGRIVSERMNKLLKLADSKAREIAARQVGKVLKVLTEEKLATGDFQGFSDNYIRVRILNSNNLHPNEFIPVRITAATGPREAQGEVVIH